MGSTSRIAGGLERRTRLRDTLIGTAFVLAPQLEPEPLGGDIGTLNHRFFFRCIRIIALFNAVLGLVEGKAGLTPGPVLLPGVACFMDRMQDGEGAYLWQTIGSLT